MQQQAGGHSSQLITSMATCTLDAVPAVTRSGVSTSMRGAVARSPLGPMTAAGGRGTTRITRSARLPPPPSATLRVMSKRVA